MEKGFDKKKCAQRNRIAAQRDGVNAFSMKFLRAPNTSTGRVLLADGEIPATIEAALQTINAQQKKAGKPELSPDQVYVQYLEAANDNFIGDRYAFMGESTLRNIAADARSGFAFMNSHRTGRLSQPSELPFGRTFAGRFEVSDSPQGPRRRSVLAVYMLRGVHPNGANGPSTDDLNASINGRTIFDVSVGLWGGQAICDVCGSDLRAEECGHIPGTRHGMDDDQIAAQKARGVTDGRASYTIENANCSEVSAVYDGAVPGAGFQKAMEFANDMQSDEWAEVQKSFSGLFGGDEKESTMKELVEKIVAMLKGEAAANAAAEGLSIGQDIAAITAERDELKARVDSLEKKSRDEAERAEAAAVKERTARIDAEVSNFLKEHDSKMGQSLRSTVEGLYRGAKLGVVSLRREKPGVAANAPEAERFEMLTATLSAEASAIVVATVEAFVKSLPVIGSRERIEAGGSAVDLAAANAAGEGASDPDADRDAKIKARAKKDGVSYEVAHTRVIAEERGSNVA